MLTDFHDTIPNLPVEAYRLNRLAQRQWPLAVMGICIVFVTGFAKPLDEREGLWKQPVAEVQMAPSLMALNAPVSGWQAFQTWQGVLLEDAPPPLDPSILIPQAEVAVAPIIRPISNSTNPAPLRGETSMPEVSKSSSVAVAPKAQTPTPTDTTVSSANTGQTTSATSATNVLAAFFSGFSNAKLSTTPVSSGFAATLSSSSSAGKSLSNLGANVGSKANSNSSSSAGSKGNSNGGGSGFGGSRRG
jgi:hypothetical protein